ARPAAAARAPAAATAAGSPSTASTPPPGPTAADSPGRIAPGPPPTPAGPPRPRPDPGQRPQVGLVRPCLLGHQPVALDLALVQLQRVAPLPGLGPSGGPDTVTVTRRRGRAGAPTGA